jgi:hypothetical protein
MILTLQMEMTELDGDFILGLPARPPWPARLTVKICVPSTVSWRVLGLFMDLKRR